MITKEPGQMDCDASNNLDCHKMSENTAKIDAISSDIAHIKDSISHMQRAITEVGAMTTIAMERIDDLGKKAVEAESDIGRLGNKLEIEIRQVEFLYKNMQSNLDSQITKLRGDMLSRIDFQRTMNGILIKLVTILGGIIISGLTGLGAFAFHFLAGKV